MKEYMKSRRERRRNQLIELSGSKCKKCNSTDRLEFDHRDRKQKLFNLSGCNLDKNWSKILEEHSKCDLLCLECHKEKTRTSGDLAKEPWNKNSSLQFVHGTARMYSEQACRCVRCVDAKRSYRSKKISYHEVLRM